MHIIEMQKNGGEKEYFEGFMTERDSLLHFPEN